MKSLKFMAWFAPMLLVGAAIVYAAAPVGGYAPNATLDPDCAPGDTDCFVIAPGSEPWFGVDDNAEATDNTEEIYHMNKVGVGTSTPEQALHVIGNPLAISYISSRNDDTTARNHLSFNRVGNAVASVIGTPGMFVRSTGDGAGDITSLRFGYYDGASNTDRLAMLNTGEIGIGTSAPEKKLHVVGDVRVTALPTGTSAAAATGGTYAGAVCIDTTGDMYVDTDGTCS